MTNSVTNSQSEFSVSFEGEAFASHTMDVRDLGPALIALGQAFDRANSLLNGNRSTISLNIRATRPASFELVLVLQQVLQGASDILDGQFLTKAAVLTELIVGGSTIGAGMITVLKRLRGRRPHIVEENESGIVLEADKLRITMSPDVAKLIVDTPIRDQISAFTRPLYKEGARRLVFKQDNKELESVTRAEVAYFNTESEENDVTEYIIPKQRLQITNPAFEKQRKWRLSDGANVRWYSIEDEAFVNAVEEGLRFGKHDILVCEVVMTQRLDEEGNLRQEHSVNECLGTYCPVSN